ncbi:hypothetical protein OO013_01775 [Mangrovivirga sp. M17]|uniref:Uncharacterized protein n=1 Tax=Mangrovivirga halotolerans TaxID=2993936 RepID=A0ABT3RLS9_9BACT|nr:hypothetical protein [Mangrovivirga halotolerans]MCX2742572.1 hypothetical protein [Mangrovivirga halotolerans]
MKRVLLISFLFLYSFLAKAQCSMCAATLETNVSEDGGSLASNLNTGILYLFLTPYVAIGIIAFFWYRTSKRNVRNKLNNSYS